MSMATRLKWYLEAHRIPYDLTPHTRTRSSAESAEAAHIPSARLAKGVLLEDERGYVMAIVPASEHVDLDEMARQLHRSFELASEAELEGLFTDCEAGAAPPVGTPYNVPMVVDDSLLSDGDVWFEAGDHEQLVHMAARSFRELLEGCRHGRFGTTH